ncbi:MAG: aspartate 1-decarboxylase [Candidatus Altiarchaeota archaeon]
MMRSMLKSKIHGATVTGCRVDYVGSITIDKALMEAVGLCVWEKVLVSDITNGERFETYVIEGGKGAIEANGAAAKLVNVGDKIIIMSFGLFDEKEAEDHKPKIVSVDGKNRETLSH